MARPEVTGRKIALVDVADRHLSARSFSVSGRQASLASRLIRGPF
jgi:hypothetical protein